MSTCTEGTENATPVIVVCGKGGVGKTAISALLAQSMIELGVKPLLLVDADPAGGLVSAIGERVEKTLAGLRDELVQTARTAGDSEREALARSMDYLLLETLAERKDYSLLAMGRNTSKSCYCPANTLLRQAIDSLSESFGAIVIDAEAGLEQIHRRITRRSTHTIVVTDGSKRSTDTLETIVDMVENGNLFCIANKSDSGRSCSLPCGVAFAGAVPMDEQLREYDRQGRSLWDLPETNKAREAVHAIANSLHLPVAPYNLV